MGSIATVAADPVAGHEDVVPARAPGNLEAVRSFLSLHEHERSGGASVPPSPASIESWLRAGRLIGEGVADPAELEWALTVQEALRMRVRASAGAPVDPVAEAVLDRAAAEAQLRVHFDAGCPVRPEADGVRGAIGGLLATSILAVLDGSFHRLRECLDPGCTTVFFDRSRSGTGKWCSMASCGNRNKVRRFRARERERAASAIGSADEASRP